MASLDRHRRMWSLGLFVLPLLAVKLAATMFGGGAPSPASASNEPLPAISDPALAGADSASLKIEWTPQQHAAAEHVRQLASKTFGPTPLLYTGTQKIAPNNPAPISISVPMLPRLRAVMATSGGNKALVNSQFYQVGEQVRNTSWTVQAINIDERSVTLEDSSGDTVTIIVQTPG